MSKKETFTTQLVIGFLGIATGSLISWSLFHQRNISANTILEKVRKAFLKEGPIEGSWIEMKQVPLQKFAVKTTVYYGGITRYEDGNLIQYEFLADAKTGTVIDIYRL
ncbi:PepSY domain-containing protein [Pediococcus siamensis]|uniref:PepSY domain-containing protein n=1 Tax=Pediococcus siamensis TaxID=381829 RepID=UPI0039A0DAC8